MNSKYKRMLDGMQAKEKRKRWKKSEPWFLYILRCADASLYTGITNNLERRLKAHTAGRASKFTRPRRPVEMCYQESCKSRTQALVREYEVKRLPRKKKILLIINGNRISSPLVGEDQGGGNFQSISPPSCLPP